MGRTSHAKQRLMDAAYSLICEYSYGAVTIDAICERAQVKKGSFYYFFASKSDLALATIDGWWSNREAVLHKFFNPEIKPVQRLRGYLDLVTQLQLNTYNVTGQLLGCPLFTLGAEICTQDERLRARISSCLNRALEIFAQAIADGQATGDIEEGEPRTKARALLSYYEGILTLARIENDPALIRAMTASALDAIGVRERNDIKIFA